MYSNHNSSGTLIITLFGATISVAVVWFWPDLMGPDRATAIAQPSLQTDTLASQADAPAVDNWTRAARNAEFGEIMSYEKIREIASEKPHVCFHYSDAENNCEVISTYRFDEQLIHSDSYIPIMEEPFTMVNFAGHAFKENGLYCTDPNQLTYGVMGSSDLPVHAKNQILQAFRQNTMAFGKTCTAFFSHEDIIWAKVFDTKGQRIEAFPPTPLLFTTAQLTLRMPDHTLALADIDPTRFFLPVGDFETRIANAPDPDSIPLWSQADQHADLGEFIPTSEILREAIAKPYTCLLYVQSTSDCETIGILKFHQKTLIAQGLFMLSDQPLALLDGSTPIFIHDGLLCMDPSQSILDIRDQGTISPHMKQRILEKIKQNAWIKERYCTAYFRKDGALWGYDFDMQGKFMTDNPAFPMEYMSEKPSLRMPHTIIRVFEQLRAGKRT